MPILSLQRLSVTYQRGRHEAPVKGAEDIDLTVQLGEVVGLVGESGSGKTTVMKAIAGLVRTYAGKIEIDGTDLSAIKRLSVRRRWVARRVGLVFQNAGESLVPRMTILEQVALPLRVHRMGSNDDIVRRAQELLDLVRLPSGIGHRRVEEVSGGQRQRVAVARSLALHPRLLIADEPTSALDVSVRTQLITLLGELRRETGVSIIVISHDLATVEYLADQIVVMHQGRAVEHGTGDALRARLRHPYSRDLWEASPSLVRPAGHLRTAPVVRPASGRGCSYDSRCDRWMPQCSELVPQLTGPDDQRARCFHPLEMHTSRSA